MLQTWKINVRILIFIYRKQNFDFSTDLCKTNFVIFTKNQTNCVSMFSNKRKTLFTIILITGAFIVFYCCFIQVKLHNSHICINCAFDYKATLKIKHSKWIVVTTISKPTEQLKKLVAIPDWKVVVVGDTKTPKTWNHPGCVYLSLDDQLKLGYQITNHLPYNSYTRKMIGYLFAIQNGAQFIYDTDDDNCPTEGKLNFNLEPITSGLIYADETQTVVNPLPHFGQPQLWPRGFPLERITRQPNRTYHLCTFLTPAVQQGLVNGDPDVDAIYRLINKGSNPDISINLTFDSFAPSFTLPRGVFAPFNSQNTLFSYQALWSLFLPATVDFRVTDIWRGYWAQRLLWLVGQYLAFLPPNAVQRRNVHSYLKDFEEEIQMYKETGKLIDFLSRWQCEPSVSFFKCVESLTASMVQQKFIEDLDLKLVKLWFSDLHNIGYKQPKRIEKSKKNMCLVSENTSKNWASYSPVKAKPNSGLEDLFTLCKPYLLQDNATNCNILSDIISSKELRTSYSFHNILLVIVFNWNYLENVRTLEVLYRDHFPNMLFCSEAEDYEKMMEKVNRGLFKHRKNDIAFVNITQSSGVLGYECAIRAIEMNYKVDGYMFLGDDVLLKPWKLIPFDAARSRIQNDNYGPHSYQNLTDASTWYFQWAPWWERSCGYNATNDAFKDIEAIARNARDSRSSLFRTFMQNRFSNGVNMSVVSFSMSDIYYISKKDSWMFAQILKIFLKHGVYLEIAVPTALSGCRAGNPQTDDGFLGWSVWEKAREAPWMYFTDKSVYVHPLKLMALQVFEELYSKNYCVEFVQDYFKNW